MSRILSITLITLIILLLTLTVLAGGFYFFGWAVGFLPFPVAVVEGRIITNTQLQTRLQAFEQATSFQLANPPGPGTEDKQSILAALIDEAVVTVLSDEYGISVTSSEIQDHYLYLLPRFGISREEAGRQISEIFGWSADEYKENIVKPDLWRAKLAVKLLQDGRQYSDAYVKLLEIRREIQTEQISFFVAAGTRSDDEDSRHVGGEYGLVSYQELPLWFKSVFELEANQVSEVVASPEGYHLFYQSFRDVTQEPGRVYLSHILKKESFLREVLEKRKENAKILIVR